MLPTAGGEHGIVDGKAVDILYDGREIFMQGGFSAGQADEFCIFLAMFRRGVLR